MVCGASTERAGPFRATLARGGTDVPMTSSGDNACSWNPRLCQPPYHHYAVWKATNDPEREGSYTLSIDARARSDVAFGFILRYDLTAEVMESPSTIRAGESFPLRARIRWRDRTFDAEGFFRADGFRALAHVAGRDVRLDRQPDATFSARATAGDPGRLPVEFVFENRWMRLAASPSDIRVEGWLPLVLRVTPDPPDLGRWRGAWNATRACSRVSLADSINADRVLLEVVAERLPPGARIEINGVDAGAGGVVPLGPRARRFD